MVQKILLTGTASENFQVALREENLMRACPPTDPYRRIAAQNVEIFLACAAAIERGETHMEIAR